MITSATSRRDILRTALGTATCLGLESGLSPAAAPDTRPVYTGPNVIIIRFGGGVRRRETIDPQHTYSPFLCKELTRRGTLFKDMSIDRFRNINTSHGEGTLHILTGKYDNF
ncbi:MAG: hypothetical protein VYA46_06785, partial [Verrucomicrobiota bacterium]|nr:hypothetical protein [Verrucomicrobiota bacterium]